jgi:hypothetical protein
MGFLRRLFGGDQATDGAVDAAAPSEAAPSEAADSERAPARGPDEDDERAYELDLLRSEQARLDELAQRQLRYAEHAWRPPAQGGERRADDGERPAE